MGRDNLAGLRLIPVQDVKVGMLMDSTGGHTNSLSIGWFPIVEVEEVLPRWFRLYWGEHRRYVVADKEAKILVYIETDPA